MSGLLGPGAVGIADGDAEATAAATSVLALGAAFGEALFGVVAERAGSALGGASTCALGAGSLAAGALAEA